MSKKRDISLSETLFERYLRCQHADEGRVLTWDETRDLCSCVQTHDAGWEDAQRTLIRHNLRLVRKIARGYSYSNVESYLVAQLQHSACLSFMDLVQVGVDPGLTRAIHKYEPMWTNEQGTVVKIKFSTYAVWWIRQAMQQEIQQHALTVRIPNHLHTPLANFLRERQTLAERFGRRPLDNELLGALGIDRKELRVMQDCAQLLRPALASVPESTLDDSGATFFEDLGITAHEADPYERYAEKQRQALVAHLLTMIKERDRGVIKERYGMEAGEERTLQAIGDDMNISRERVNQIQRAAERRIREHMERLGYTPDGVIPNS